MFYIFKMFNGIITIIVVVTICLAIFNMLYYIEKKIKKLECKN